MTPTHSCHVGPKLGSPLVTRIKTGGRNVGFVQLPVLEWIAQMLHLFLGEQAYERPHVTT